MILELLACYGVTFFLQQKAGWLTDPVRDRITLFDKLLSCTFCTGFWVGLVLWWLGSLANGTVLSMSLGGYVHAWVIFAFASAATSYGADAAIQWLENNASAG
jgi:hypothetical protein